MGGSFETAFWENVLMWILGPQGVDCHEHILFQPIRNPSSFLFVKVPLLRFAALPGSVVGSHSGAISLGALFFFLPSHSGQNVQYNFEQKWQKWTFLFNFLPSGASFYSFIHWVWCCSVVQLCPILRPHGLQHIRLPCPSPSPRAGSNSCPSSQWCHPTTSSSVIPFSSWLQSFPASGSFPMSRFFASGGRSIGVSASVFPMNIQDWFPLGC